MGNQKQKWTAEEEEALLAGVAKHGPGKWKNILKDTEFAPFLVHRSNIDLKDKWRNLSVSTSGQGSKERPRTSKIKNVVAAHNAIVLRSLPAASVHPTAYPDAVVDDASNSAPELKSALQNAPRYNAVLSDRNSHTAMIFEAISTMKDMNGSDIGAILNFIERTHGVPLPPTFRKMMSTKLRRLVSQGKLEKMENRYKIKDDATLGTNTPTPSPKQKDVWHRRLQNSGSMTSPETVQDAADTAASKLADAENKYFLAAEAMKEAERVSKMAEDTESMLQLIKEIYEQCSRGEVVSLA